MKSLSSIVAICVLALIACSASFAAALDSSSVHSVSGMNQTQEAYQLGVWAFIVMLVIGLLGFGTMASIDYSDDALLSSAPDNTKNE